MKESNFKDIFDLDEFNRSVKTKVNQFSDDPSDSVWNFLEQDLDKLSLQKKRRKKAIWLSSAALLVATSSVAWMFFQPASNQQASISTSTSDNNQTEIVNENVVPASPSNNEEQPNTSALENGVSVNEPILELPVQTSTVANGNASGNNYSEVSLIEPSTQTNDVDDTKVQGGLEAGAVYDIVKAIHIAVPDYISSNRILAQQATLLNVDLAVLPDNTGESPQGENSQQSQDAAQLNSNWTVSLSFSPLLSYRRLNYTNNLDQSVRREIRDRNNFERINLGYATGLALGYDFKDKWQVRAGINYMQIGYTSTYSEETRIRLEYEDSVPGIYDPDTVFYDFYNSEGNDQKVTSRYHMIEIPVQLIYHMRTGNKISYFMGGGLSYAALLRAKTHTINSGFDGFTTIDQQGNEYVVNDTISNSGRYYRDNVNALITLGGAYKINHKLAFELSANFRYALNSVTKSKGLKQVPFSQGVNMGLSYRF